MALPEKHQKEKSVIKGVFNFNPSDGIYRDHFPGYPVVPGSLVIHAFLKAAAKVQIKGKISSVENFRFREFIIPGAYPFMMEIGEDRVSCTINLGDRKVATGVLKL